MIVALIFDRHIGVVAIAVQIARAPRTREALLESAAVLRVADFGSGIETVEIVPEDNVDHASNCIRTIQR